MGAHRSGGTPVCAVRRAVPSSGRRLHRAQKCEAAGLPAPATGHRDSRCALGSTLKRVAARRQPGRACCAHHGERLCSCCLSRRRRLPLAFSSVRVLMDRCSHAATFVVADAYLVAYIVERGVNRAVATRISYGYFFFSDLSDSVFIVRASPGPCLAMQPSCQRTTLEAVCSFLHAWLARCERDA